MYDLSSENLRIVLHHPCDGFYQGTRFDRSGVFDSLQFSAGGGEPLIELCGRWFSRYDPLMHDAVCGPAEEFSLFALPDGTWLKPGVGVLVPDGAPYDRFKLYEIANPGEWRVESGPDYVKFIHTLPGYYVYEKTIAMSGSEESSGKSKLLEPSRTKSFSPEKCSKNFCPTSADSSSFEIRHKLCTEVPLDGDVYNHNFFTLGKISTGTTREIDLHCTPEGDWRAPYSQVAFIGEGLRFTRALKEGESVFCGNIRQSGTSSLPYRFTLRESSPFALPRTHESDPSDLTPVREMRLRSSVSVQIAGDRPASKAVFWANHRIACLEPYTPLCALPGESLIWTLRYSISSH